MTTTAVAQPAGIARTAAGTRGQANVLGLPFVIITLSTALALTLVLSAVAAFSKGAVAALVCLTGVATVAVLLMTVLARRNFDIFEPYSFIILAALVGTALKAPYAALFDNDAIRRDLLLGQPLDVLLKGSIFMLIGLVALSAGYMVRVPPIRISGLRLVRRQYWERRVLTPVLAATLALSIISFFVWFRMMGVSITSLVELSQKRFYIVEGSEFQSSLGYLNWGVSVAESTFYVLLTWWLLSKKSLPLFARIGLPLTGLIALFFPILTSSRTGMVEVGLTGLIIVHFLRSGIRIRTVAIISTLTVAAFIVVTGVRGARSTEDAAARINAEEFLNATVGGRHFMDLGKTTHIIHAVPEKVPYAYGATFLKWVTAPIPRTLWPNKPSVGSGPILGPAVFGMVYAGVPPGFVAELYMNFGAIGVPVGMFLAGVILRMLYNTFLPHRRNRNAILIYAVAIVPLSYGLMQTELSKSIVSALTESIPVMLLLLAVARARPRSTTT